MTTPATPAELFRSEMFARLDAQAEMIGSLRTDSARQDELIIKLTDGLTSLINGLTSAAATAHAASQPATTAGETVTFIASILRHDQTGKKHAYFLLGGRYARFGVRVWPEVLPLLGLAEYETMPPDEYTLPAPVSVRAEVGEYEHEGETKRGPRKVIGKA